MQIGKVLGQIVAGLRDQRLLFLIAVIIALAVLAPLDVISPQGVIIIFGISAAVVLVDRLLDFLGRRSERLSSQAGGLNLRVALDFEGVEEGAIIRLERRATYTIQDPRNPGQVGVKEVLLHEAPGDMGWLCPIPSEAGSNDMVSFTFTAVDGRQWGLTVVADLLWPKVRAGRLP